MIEGKAALDYFTEHVKTCSRANEVEGSCKQ